MDHFEEKIKQLLKNEDFYDKLKEIFPVLSDSNFVIAANSFSQLQLPDIDLNASLINTIYFIKKTLFVLQNLRKPSKERQAIFDSASQAYKWIFSNWHFQKAEILSSITNKTFNIDLFFIILFNFPLKKLIQIEFCSKILKKIIKPSLQLSDSTLTLINVKKNRISHFF